jgi:Lectin C-type domain
MFWTSGSDEFHEGIFSWCASEKAVNVSMDFKFSPGEPNNWGGSENCIQSTVVADAPPATFIYNDNMCNKPIRFICEV